MKNRVLGALHGHLLGDALGVPYEGWPPERIPQTTLWRGHGTHDQPPGTWSDDGSLMLCQVASLVECGGFNPVDTGQRFVSWLVEGYQAAGGVAFGIGGTTLRALARLHQGVPSLDAGPTDESSNGNGSLMRILPIGLWYHRANSAELVAVSHDASRITHGHPRAQACCALHNLTLRGLLLSQRPDEALSTALNDLEQVYAGDETFSTEFRLVCGHPDRTGTGYVVDCWWSAWDALIETNSFQECLVRAVRFGNDTDTTAAVAGGLAGAVYGVEALPAQWLNDLRLDSEQRKLIERFADVLTC